MTRSKWALSPDPKCVLGLSDSVMDHPVVGKPTYYYGSLWADREDIKLTFEQYHKKGRNLVQGSPDIYRERFALEEKNTVLWKGIKKEENKTLSEVAYGRLDGQHFYLPVWY